MNAFLSTFKKLRQNGFAKWMTAYLVSLFGSVIWVGLVLLVSLAAISRTEPFYLRSTSTPLPNARSIATASND